MTVTLTQGLIGVGGLVALLVIWYGPWQEVCTDIARQFLFEKRDALFDLAESGKLEFSSQEYRTIRSSMQASIRFAHELTLPRFILLAVVLARRTKSEDNDLRRALNRIRDPAIREQVEQLVGQAYRALLLMMVARSSVAIVLLLLFLPVLYIIVRARPYLRGRVREVEVRAGTFIQLEADAA